MRVSGDCGELRVGYQTAATITRWAMVPSEAAPRAFDLTARVTGERDYWIRQRPLDLVVAVGKVEWRWRGVDLRRDGDDKGVVRVTITTAPEVQPRTIAAAVEARRR